VKLLVVFTFLLLLSACHESTNEAVLANTWTTTSTQPQLPSFSQSERGITVVSEGPRGGQLQTTSGNVIAYRIFRISFTNTNNHTAELELKCNQSTYALLPSLNDSVTVWLVPDAFAPAAKIDRLNFGIDGLEKLLDTCQNRLPVIHCTLRPHLTKYAYAVCLYKTKRDLARALVYFKTPEYPVDFLPYEVFRNSTSTQKELALTFGVGIDPPNQYAQLPIGKITLH